MVFSPEGLARLWTQRRSAVLVAALLLTVVAGWLLPRLRLETDLAGLLPDDSATAAAYGDFLSRFGGFEKVYVVVEHPGFAGDPEDLADRLIDAADRYVEAAGSSPEVAHARSGIEPVEERFVLERVVRRAPLLSNESLATLAARLEPAAIEQRVARLRSQLASPSGAFQRALAPFDPLGLSSEMLAKSAAGDLPVDPLTGAFLDASGTASLVVITPAVSEIDPEAGRRLLTVLDAAELAVGEALGPGLRFSAVGGPLYAVWDEALLRSDLQRTLSGSLIACGLVLVLALGGVSLPAAALGSVLVALVWTGGGLAVSVGSVAAVSLGFAAVLVGLGIDYGVHAGVRFAQACREGLGRQQALADMARHSGLAIATSAATTAVAFLALALAHFRPLREVGVMVALGIVAIFLAAATLGGALLASLPLGRSAGRGPLWGVLGRVAEALPAVGRRFPRSVLATTLALSALALVGIGRLELDANPSSLRPADHPLLAAEKVLAQTFGLGSDTATVLVRGTTLDQTLQRTAAVAEQLRGSAGPTVTAASDLLGAGASQGRLEALQALPWGQAADTLESALRAQNLNPEGLAPGIDALRSWAAGQDPAPVTLDDLPPSVRELLRQDDDGVWSALRVRLPEGAWEGGPPAELVLALESVAPGVQIASAAALGLEMRDLARQDLTRLGGAALGAVLLTLVVAFRGRLTPMGLALVPVTLGSLWTCGLLGLAGGRLDLVGLTVVPMLLGIGIDDGLHALHGAARQTGGAPLARAVRGAGRAMTLTTLTTVVGFGSLALSRVPGLRQGGLLVGGGVVACLLATLVVLPAIEAARDRRPRVED